MSRINPNTIYYLSIYAVIILVHVVAEYNDQKRGALGSSAGTWEKYGYFGLQLVYSSVGIVISLFNRDTNWLSAILMVLVFLVLTPALVDNSFYPPKIKFAVNIVIAFVVIGTSTYFNQTILITKPVVAEGPAQHNYQVAIPYLDTTLKSFLGSDRFDGRRLVYVTTVLATSRGEAVTTATQRFWEPNSTDVVEFDQRKQKNSDDMIIYYDQVVAEAKN
jgi:hypothetical protein